MKTFCVIALIVTGLAAGLSVLALPFWLMGVPGVENSYARGWKLGLYTVLGYPLAWFSLFAFWRGARKQAAAEQLASLSLWTGLGSLVLLGMAAAVVMYAFKVMSRR